LTSSIQARNSSRNTKDENLWPPISNANWRDTLKGVSIEDYLSNYNSFKKDLHVPSFHELSGTFDKVSETARRFGKSYHSHRLDELLREGHSV